jgi:hypothetical protein
MSKSGFEDGVAKHVTIDELGLKLKLRLRLRKSKYCSKIIIMLNFLTMLVVKC